MDTVKIKAGTTRMVAHRGLSGIETENTCPAFVAAANRSYFGIETDVHVGRGGEFIIIHDETLTRVSRNEYTMNVEKSALSRVKKVVLPDKDGSLVRQDIRVPMLDEYVLICKKYGKWCVLELKNKMDRPDVERLVERIRALEWLDHMIFISFSFDNCVILRDILPEAEIQYLTSQEIDEALINKIADARLDLDTAYTYLDREKVELLHSRGIKVNCWTCDDPKSGEALADMGVDFITSNILEGR